MCWGVVIGVVFGLSHYVLGIAAGRPRLWEVPVSCQRKAGTSRIGCPLRGGGVFLPACFRCSPFDFDPGGIVRCELEF